MLRHGIIRVQDIYVGMLVEVIDNIYDLGHGLNPA
jgi:hypothetical protein